MTRPSWLAGVVLTATAIAAPPAAPARAADTVRPYPGMMIIHDITLTPGSYHFADGAGLVIAADGVTVHGEGVTIDGPGVAGQPASYTGTGLTNTGHDDVVVSGLAVHGFRIGIRVAGARRATLDHINVNDNFTDPDFGWGEQPAGGGLLLDGVSHSTVTASTGTGNWNGLDLHASSDNVIRGNDFDHCSNVCLRLWHASGNRIRHNNFSWGIRIRPGETHARDSASALITTRSNDNRIVDNDFTHGGDGVFIRVLDGVVSTGNVLVGNDASYAHNNAFESWSPHNTYRNNRANYSSYGFWLGGSDHTTLLDNEAAYNGTINHNAPEKRFGNAGIAVVKGSSSHFILAGNRVHDNGGAGIALGYRPDYPAYHWVIRSNAVTSNTGYGIYAYDARWIDLVGNKVTGNGSGDVHTADGVDEWQVHDGNPAAPPPHAELRVSRRTVQAGEAVTFTAAGSRPGPGGAGLSYRWELGDGATATAGTVRHVFDRPGFYRLGLTVRDGRSADLAGTEIHVVDPGPEEGTSEPGSAWSATAVPRPFDWGVDRTPPDATSPALYSGSGPNFDRGIARQVTVPANDPALTLRTRYDIENGWDFGYVQVSTDDGATWRTVPVQGGQPSNLGPGLTGNSGGWTTRTADLSGYAGRTVLVAFRYVTDGAVDGRGWWIGSASVAGEPLTDGSTLDGWRPVPAPEPTHLSLTNDHDGVDGTTAIRLATNARSARLSYPKQGSADWNLTDATGLALWLSVQHDGPMAFDAPQPVLRLVTPTGTMQFNPTQDLLAAGNFPNSEARAGWQRLVVPLAGSSLWARQVIGEPDLSRVQRFELETHSPRGDYVLRLDGLHAVR